MDRCGNKTDSPSLFLKLLEIIVSLFINSFIVWLLHPCPQNNLGKLPRITSSSLLFAKIAKLYKRLLRYHGVCSTNKDFMSLKSADSCVVPFGMKSAELVFESASRFNQLPQGCQHQCRIVTGLVKKTVLKNINSSSSWYSRFGPWIKSVKKSINHAELSGLSSKADWLTPYSVILLPIWVTERKSLI